MSPYWLSSPCCWNVLNLVCKILFSSIVERKVKFFLILRLVVILLCHVLFVISDWNFYDLVNSEGPGATRSWWGNNTSVKILIVFQRKTVWQLLPLVWLERKMLSSYAPWWRLWFGKNNASIMTRKGQFDIRASRCYKAHYMWEYWGVNIQYMIYSISDNCVKYKLNRFKFFSKSSSTVCFSVIDLKTNLVPRETSRLAGCIQVLNDLEFVGVRGFKAAFILQNKWLVCWGRT